ncbi:MAG: DUF2190 domain-containing protein [Deltaproteobacteria bacterium]|nr:MAG: DUF2190 domain-containing protein [Deltaproteobacteria bacterium]
MHNPLLTKSLVAGAAVAAYRIVKQSDDNTVVQGAAATDKLMGISDNLGAANGARCEVHLAGPVEVEYGGNVAVGDPLTSDANGKAVVAAPAVGVNNRIIGFAVVAGAASDIGSCNIAPGVMQGA